MFVYVACADGANFLLTVQVLKDMAESDDRRTVNDDRAFESTLRTETKLHFALGNGDMAIAKSRESVRAVFFHVFFIADSHSSQVKHSDHPGEGAFIGEASTS